MGAELIRVTANLVPRSAAALEQLIEDTGNSRTDVLNQALRVYQWFVAASGGTGQLRYIDAAGNEQTVVIV